MHLSTAAFVDLLDGTTLESSVPHLAACDRCREQLKALRGAASAVGGVDVPEPSPLFWDHLSARVRDAVAAETVSTSWWDAGWWRFVTVGTLALCATVLVLWSQMDRRGPASPTSELNATIAVVPIPDDTGDDESLRFVADLASDVDLDAVLDSGLVPGGSAERALAQMDQRERVALQRLLREALTNGGA